MEKSAKDFMDEAVSEIAVKLVLGLAIDLKIDVESSIGRETAGIIVIPVGCETFVVHAGSISADIVIFTSVHKGEVQIRGWLHTHQLIARTMRDDGRIEVPVAVLEPLEALVALSGGGTPNPDTNKDPGSSQG